MNPAFAEYYRLIGFILLAIGVAAPSLIPGLAKDAKRELRRRHWQSAIRTSVIALVTAAVAVVALIAGVVLLFQGVQV